MANAAATDKRAAKSVSHAVLSGAAILWFTTAFVGQMFFALYIVLHYGGSAVQGDFETWNKRLINGFIEGDLAGNISLVVHIVLAAIITFSGPLQFVPAIRKHAIGFHRWNGRVYIATAFVISIGAAYMIATRGAAGFNTNAILINAAAIVFCAAMTIGFVLARRIDSHHRWALRTFMFVSGVWFIRIGYAFLGVVFQGSPPGSTDNLDGPTDVAVAYLSFFLPIAVLQLYFFAQDSARAEDRYAMAAVVALAAAVTGIGVFGVTFGAWLPRVMSVF